MLLPKRAYNSTKRLAKAQKTRDSILASAEELFESRGFEEVTIEEIAIRAEVSTPTIYALFQSKSGILRALIDVAIPPEQHESIVQKIEMEKSVSKRLELTAMLSRQIYDAERAQLGLFRDASILNPEFKKLEIERERRRYKRQEESFKRLAKEKVPSDGLDESKSRDILWALTGRDIYRMLVIEQGWSSDEYEKWLKSVLVQILLKSKNTER